MEEEIARELHTFPDEYELVPLAFARELPRGGKPQLFYLALSKLTEAEIKSRLLEAEERMEFVDWENADLPALCGRWLTSPLKRPAEVAVVKSCFTYEGWMALRLVKNYLSENTVAGTQ